MLLTNFAILCDSTSACPFIVYYPVSMPRHHQIKSLLSASSIVSSPAVPTDEIFTVTPKVVTNNVVVTVFFQSVDCSSNKCELVVAIWEYANRFPPNAIAMSFRLFCCCRLSGIPAPRFTIMVSCGAQKWTLISYVCLLLLRFARDHVCFIRSLVIVSMVSKNWLLSLFSYMFCWF